MQLVIVVINYLREDESRKVYIHCKGGHGRSVIIAGLVYGYYTNVPHMKVIQILSMVHASRPIMKPKFRKIGYPQTNRQKHQFSEIIKIMMNHKNKNTYQYM